MDLRMPGMDGVEAVQRIREDIPACRKTRILALTASIYPVRDEECRANGMDGHIAKPVNYIELSEKINAALLELPASEAA